MSLNYQSLLLFFLTVISFAIAKITYHRGNNNILLQPLLVGVILVVACLYLFNIPYRQYLDSNEGRQPHRVGPQAQTRHVYIAGGKAPVLKQGSQLGLGQRGQTHSGWQRDHQSQAQGPVQRGGERFRTLRRMLA